MERDRGVVYFTYHRPFDDSHRTMFTMEWWMEGYHLGPSWRGQVFFADPLPYIKQQIAAGLRVDERRDY